jgi:hypothetical protein
MAKFICSVFIVIAACSNVSAQTGAEKSNPMKHALIYEEPHAAYNRAHMADYVNPQFTNDAKGYQDYVRYIVSNYAAQYNLNKVQEANLELAMAALYNSKGVTADKVHDLIADKLKTMLGFKQYLDWGKSDAFPEYSYFYDWNHRLNIRYSSN